MEIKKEELMNEFDNKGIFEDIQFIINSVREAANKVFKKEYDKFIVESIEDDLVMRIRPDAGGMDVIYYDFDLIQLVIESYAFDEGGMSFKRIKDYFFNKTGIYPDSFVIDPDTFTMHGESKEDKSVISIEFSIEVNLK